MWSKKFFALMMAGLFCFSSAMAQGADPKDPDDIYPEKPKFGWVLGLNAGMLIGGTDVDFAFKGLDNLGYGGILRKNLGHVGAIQGRYLGGNLVGQNWRLTSGIQFNDALNGGNDSSVNYWGAGEPVYHNHKTVMHEASLEVVIHPFGIKFYQSKSVVSPYFSLGAGGLLYRASVDAKNASDSMYDWRSVTSSTITGDFDNKRDAVDAINDELDGTYETLAEAHDHKFDISDDDPEKRLVHTVVASGALGIDFRLGDRWTLGLEERITATFDDLIDGQRWTERNVLSTNTDIYHYPNLSLKVQLGGSDVTPIHMVNPFDYTYGKIAELDTWKPTDSDNDGVIDDLDREPNTEAGAPVDTRGVTLDSDKDGCPDHQDPEPFSSPEIAIEDCKNVYSNTLDEDRVRAIVKEMLPKEQASGGGDWFLPMIFFNLDKDEIKPEYYDELAHVATVMKKNPSLKVNVTGHADTRASEEYNNDLSQRRAANAVNWISTKYGIDASRFNINFVGESSELVEGASAEFQHKWNRRVTFEAATN